MENYKEVKKLEENVFMGYENAPLSREDLEELEYAFYNEEAYMEQGY